MQTTNDAAISPPLFVLERKIKGHTKSVRSVAVSPDGTWMVSGSNDRTVKTWDPASGKCRATLEGHKGPVYCVSVTPDRTRIISGSKDKTLRVWDARSGRRLAVCNGHTERVWSVAALPDNQRALSGSWDGTLKLWDIITGKCLKTIKRSTLNVGGVALFPGGEQALAGYADGVIKRWDLETGECRATLKGHTKAVNSIQITPDGRSAVSCSNDRTVRLWDLETGICKGAFEGHGDNVYSVALSPDGAAAVSASPDDHTLRIWDVNTGTCLQKNYFAPISAAFSPDGSRLIVGNAVDDETEYSIYIYRLTGETAARAVIDISDERYTNAKVVLVGESGVGKSGLAHRLIDDKYVKTDSTHGMKVWPLPLPMEKTHGMQREALLWDLAGQEDYRLIHQLFLDETALALLLFNPQKEDPFSEAADWLKALDAVTARAGREAVKLLIAARTDRGTVKVSQAKIDAFLEQYGMTAYLATSAKRGENCSDGKNNKQPSALKELIARHIPWDTLPWTSTPRLLRELKDAVITLKTAPDSGLLRFAELTRRLKETLPKETFTEKDVRTAVTLLANHGLVMPFQFGDLVLLKPELLNGYASAVILAARAHTDEIGCVSEQAVVEKTINYDAVERLPSADEDLLLRAMVQTFLDKSLCIAEDPPGGRQLIFPSQYRRERAIPGHPEICVSYTFSGEPSAVYTTLVVRLWYSQGYENKELWRNAAEFKTTKDKTAGLLMTPLGEGEATLCVFFDPDIPDEVKVVFIEFVHQHLQRYAQDIRRERRYVCKCGKPVKDADAVRQQLEDQKDFVFCMYCGGQVPLIDHIEQRLGSDLVAQKVHEMDQAATLKQDSQSKEQILIGHMMSISGEAGQIFRPTVMFDYGIDGEVEFKNAKGKATGKKIYVQLKSGSSFLRERKRDNVLIFDVKEKRHLEYWVSQPVDVYLVIRDETGLIRWMNVTEYLKDRKDKTFKRIEFTGEKLDAAAVMRVRKQRLK